MKAKKLISLLIATAMTLSLVPSTGMVALAEEQVQETVGATVAPTQEAVTPTPTQEVADVTPTPAPTQKVGDILDVFEVSNPRLTVLNGIERANYQELSLQEGNIDIYSDRIEIKDSRSNQVIRTIDGAFSEVHVKGYALNNTITVDCHDLNLILEDIETDSEIDLRGNNTKLTLKGTNKIGPLWLPNTYPVQIDGDGSLECNIIGHSFATDNSHSLIINSGIVKANNIQYIDSLTVNGGTVKATNQITGINNITVNGGYVESPSITGNNFIIDGGSVKISGDDGLPIIKNSDGLDLKTAEINLTDKGINGAQAVSYMVDGGKRIQTSTDNANKLYLHLTKTAHTVDVFVGGKIYTYSVDERGNVSGGDETGVFYDLSHDDVSVDSYFTGNKVYVWQSDATKNNNISIKKSINLILENINTTGYIEVLNLNATLTLVGSNKISTLSCSGSPHITIDGEGSLNLSWIDHGGQLDAKLSLTINSGKVTLTDGIGSHNPINALTINGGYFEIPQIEAADNVVINGGSVKVTNWNGIQPTNGSDNVYLREVTIPDKSADVYYSVDSDGKAIPASTDDSGKLYLYLTAGEHNVSVNSGGKAYTCKVSDTANAVTAVADGYALDLSKGSIAVESDCVKQSGKTQIEGKVDNLRIWQSNADATLNKIEVNSDDVNIVLDNVNTNSGIDVDGKNVSIELNGANTTKYLQLHEFAEATIDGKGSLNLITEICMLGMTDNAPSLTINGGKIKSTNGICYMKTLTINGGYVSTAKIEYSDKVVIDGGSVEVENWNGIQPKNSNGEAVVLCKVDLTLSGESDIAGLDVAYMLDESNKWIKTTTDFNSTLYLYLTEGSHTVEVRINNNIYKFAVVGTGFACVGKTGVAYDLADGSITVDSDGIYQDGNIMGDLTQSVYIYQSDSTKPTANNITVNASATLILEDINIDTTTDCIKASADTKLNLVGKNKITTTGGSWKYGIYSSTNLVIDGTGSIEIIADKPIVANPITINGGTITATGNKYAIVNANGGIIINGGNVTANAIGTPAYVSDSIYGIYAEKDIIIHGGTVTAYGTTVGIEAYDGNITMDGGNVTATGNSRKGIATKLLKINGGTVTATGGEDGIDVSGATINGGIVTATGTSVTGISTTTISINGGFVTANGSKYGISGSGNNQQFNGIIGNVVIINGGSVKASSMNKNPYNNAQQAIYLRTVAIPDKSADVTYTVDGGDEIPTHTDTDGSLYFYLTPGAHNLKLSCNGNVYTCNIGEDGTVGKSEIESCTLDLAKGSIEVQSDKIMQGGEEKIQGKVENIRITQSNNTQSTQNTITVGENVSDLNLILAGVNISSGGVESIYSDSALTLTLEGKNDVVSNAVSVISVLNRSNTMLCLQRA